MNADPFYVPVHTHVLNPKSITMGELYGEVNKLTLEWRDGLMAIIVRQCVNVSINRIWCIVIYAKFVCFILIHNCMKIDYLVSKCLVTVCGKLTFIFKISVIL